MHFKEVSSNQLTFNQKHKLQNWMTGEYEVFSLIISTKMIHNKFLIQQIFKMLCHRGQTNDCQICTLFKQKTDKNCTIDQKYE